MIGKVLPAIYQLTGSTRGNAYRNEPKEDLA